jgi:hypothetical protein
VRGSTCLPGQPPDLYQQLYKYRSAQNEAIEYNFAFGMENQQSFLAGISWRFRFTRVKERLTQHHSLKACGKKFTGCTKPVTPLN